MLTKFILIIALIASLAACGKSEQAATPTSGPAGSQAVQDEAALRKFLDRKTTRVRTIQEIEADEKAKEKKRGNP